MSSIGTRRSQALETSPVKNLVGLSDEQINTLKEAYKVTNLQELSMLDRDDINDILGTAAESFMQRKKLTAVATFLSKGGVLDSSTSMTDVMTMLSTSNSSGTITAAMPTGTTTTTGGGGGLRQNPNSSPIKLSASDFPKFSGDIGDQETYKERAQAMIGMSAFKFLLQRDPVGAEEEERDEELYNLFKASFLEGTAYHVITRATVAEDGTRYRLSGRRVWNDFQSWCNSGGRKNTLIKNIKKELRELKLNGDDIDGFEYVNHFINKINRLTELGEKRDDTHLLQSFVENIVDSDFDTVQQLLHNYLLEIDRGTRTLNCKEFYDMVESRQRSLNTDADNDMEIKSRRNVRSRDDDDSVTSAASSHKADANDVWNVPKVLWNDLNANQRRAFSNYRRSAQAGKKPDTQAIGNILSTKDNSGDSKKKGDGKPGSKKKQRKKRKLRKVKICKANAQLSLPSTEDVHIRMKSDDEFDSSSDESGEIKTPATKKTKVKTNKVIRKGPSIPNVPKKFPYATILDSGTEWTVVGGPSWSIVRHYAKSLQMAAVDDAMSTVPMTLCDAVTAVVNSEGHVQLVGVRKGGYSAGLTDDEAVINTHYIREAGWKVDCVAKRHGGTQSIVMPQSGEIPLEYNANKYKLYLSCRAPTPTELETIHVNWIDCHLEDLAIDEGSKPVRRRQLSNPVSLVNLSSNQVQDATKDPALLDVMDGLETTTVKRKGTSSTLVEKEASSSSSKVSTAPEINWQDTMGMISEEVADKTKQNTTQYYPTLVESENRSYPRQHRQKRLHAIQCRRIPGKTCGDTFFSSIRSIRGYTCAQLFVATTWDFLYVKLLRRESQVPGAYKDFCNEVGVPNMLLTDNSKVQAGRKFQEINRQNQTKHVFSTPHCQNQNTSERKIQDVKHLAIMLLYRTLAPLTFWCYAVLYVVDCLNHTAKRSKDWQVPASMKEGSTQDISVFRFTFWQPIEYLAPNIKFPECSWLKGRFVGIAWKHGDPFTYRVWTEHIDEGWKGGRELIRNVVRPRREPKDATSSASKSDYEELTFKLNPNVNPSSSASTKRKKRKAAAVLDDNATAPSKRPRKDRSSKESDLNGKATEVPKSTSVSFSADVQVINSEESSNENDVDKNQSTSSSSNSTHDCKDDGASTADGSNLEEHSSDGDKNISNITEVNDELLSVEKNKTISSLVCINGYRWVHGLLQLRLQMNTEEPQWVDFRDARTDYPRQTAQYLVNNYKSRSRNEGKDRALSWAKKTLRDLDRAVRRVARLYDFFLDDDDNIRKIRRQKVRAKKKKSGFGQKVFKFGIQVPRTVKEALQLDAKNGNTLWQDALEIEMSALEDMDCFEFMEKGYDPGEGWQRTRLHMIFDVKADTLRHKARLVAGGHLVDALDHEVYSSTVKGISVKLLHVIAHSQKLEALCGDIGNAFVTAYTEEKVYCIAGPEFGKRQGMTVIIKKALYGLASSAARFHRALADNFRDMGFTPTRFDQDVWIRKAKDGKSYEYICTHVDDFCIFAKRPMDIMKQIQDLYTVKAVGPPEYYLGNDFKKDKKGRWQIGCKKYLKEAIRRIESMFGTLSKHDTPMVAGDHPEMDTSPLLDDKGHKQYQMLIGILNWIVILGRLDVCYAVSSLSRFVACPLEGHLERALYIFGYLKKKQNRRVTIDSREPVIL